MNKTPRELLETHFDTAFAAPDGIKKLRELILTLAMQGKLVAQDPNDPSARQLLKEIEAEKKRLVKEGKIKAPKPLPEIKPKEVPYALPQGWEWVRLNDVLDVRDGTHDTPKYADSGFPLITSKNIYTGKLSFDDVKYISAEDHQKISERSKVDTGDILFAMIGSIGNPVIVECDTEFSIKNVALFKYHLAGKPDNRYLHYFLTRAQENMKAISSGAVQSFVSLSFLRGYLLPLPPIAEQRRIVAKIDQLMVCCDELEKLRDEREQKRRSVHTAALKQMLDASLSSPPRRRGSSDLIELDSRLRGNDNSFADAWQFITQHFGELYAVRENVTELRKAILQLGVQGKLVAHNGQSSDWTIRHLKELTTKIGSGSTPSGGKESYQEVGVPLIRSMNIHFGGFAHKGLVFLNEAQADKLKNVSVRTDDVLLNITGASIGRVAIAPEGMEGARVNQHVCIIRPTLEIIPRFIEAFLASPIVQNMIDDVQVGATREALTKSMIERFEILLPPLDEQHRIVAKIEQLMSLCDTLEQQIAAATCKQTTLLDAVMAQV